MLHGEALLHAALQCCGNFWRYGNLIEISPEKALTAFGSCQIWRPPAKKYQDHNFPLGSNLQFTAS
jgi:hypothetical protein